MRCNAGVRLLAESLHVQLQAPEKADPKADADALRKGIDRKRHIQGLVIHAHGEAIGDVAAAELDVRAALRMIDDLQKTELGERVSRTIAERLLTAGSGRKECGNSSRPNRCYA